MNAENLFRLILMVPIAMLSLSIHESAHGYVSYKMGDPTAKNLGRITLNPIKHFDIIGFICMVFFRVGWAKPVPVNSRYYKNPRMGMALTAAAGPISNLLLGFVGILCSKTVIYISTLTGITESTVYVFTTAYMFFELLAWCNVSLAIFNLIPVPPFDGSRVLFVFLPPKYYFGIMKYEQIIMIVMLALFFFGAFDIPLSFLANAVVNGMTFIVELIPVFR